MHIFAAIAGYVHRCQPVVRVADDDEDEGAGEGVIWILKVVFDVAETWLDGYFAEVGA